MPGTPAFKNKNPCLYLGNQGDMSLFWPNRQKGGKPSYTAGEAHGTKGNNRQSSGASEAGNTHKSIDAAELAGKGCA